MNNKIQELITFRIGMRKVMKFSSLLFVLTVASSQKSYYGAQLLRLQSNRLNDADLDDLVESHGGTIWKHSMHYMDVLFEKDQLREAKAYIDRIGISYEILINNVNDIIGQKSLQNRTKRDVTMNWNNYHSYDTIKNFLISMQQKYPMIAKIFNIGSSIEKRQLLVLRITNNINRNPVVWVDGGIHAREWISPASVTFAVNYILGSWDSLPLSLRNITWYFMPILNPDGYEYSQNEDRMWRKNRRRFSNSKCDGVDLNRNFDINWNAKNSSKSVCTETYKGTKPFSEPETAAVSNFLHNHKRLLKAYLTFHSYGQNILWPYGYTYSEEASNVSNMKKVAVQIKSNIKKATGSSYTASRSTALGLIAGASDDWCKKTFDVPYAYTIELRDTGKYGFILPAREIIPTANEALQVLKNIAGSL